MYVVAYYTVFAMRNESTIVNCKKIQMLYYCFSLHCMIQQYNLILPDHVVQRLSIFIWINFVLNAYSQGGSMA